MHSLNHKVLDQLCERQKTSLLLQIQKGLHAFFEISAIADMLERFRIVVHKAKARGRPIFHISEAWSYSKTLSSDNRTDPTNIQASIGQFLVCPGILLLEDLQVVCWRRFLCSKGTAMPDLLLESTQHGCEACSFPTVFVDCVVMSSDRQNVGSIFIRLGESWCLQKASYSRILAEYVQVSLEIY
jgi:hypothetical protein